MGSSMSERFWRHQGVSVKSPSLRGSSQRTSSDPLHSSSPWFARSSSCTTKWWRKGSCSILSKSYPGGRRVKCLKHRKDIPHICVCSTKAQTLSPGTSRSAHIENRSAQVFALEPFLKDKYQEVMDSKKGPWSFPNVVRQRTSVGWFLGSSSSLRWQSFALTSLPDEEVLYAKVQFPWEMYFDGSSRSGGRDCLHDPRKVNDPLLVHTDFSSFKQRCRIGSPNHRIGYSFGDEDWSSYSVWRFSTDR